MTTDTVLRDPLAIAESWHAEGRSVAIATVIETWGSAPRPVGCTCTTPKLKRFTPSRSVVRKRGASENSSL